MEIRLHGTPTETAAVLAALTRVLDVTAISAVYADRLPSTLQRIYLTAAPRGERQ